MNMKNKIRKIIGGLLISMFVMVFTIPSQGAQAQIGNDTQANIILRKQEGTDNQVHLSLETTNTKSMASIQLKLEVKTPNIQDITGITMKWDDAIEQTELKEMTYNNGNIHIYIVSKNELGEQDAHQRRIEIGTLTIETQEKYNIDVTLKANQETLKLASINHESTNLTNKPSQIALRINEKATNEGNGGTNTPEEGENQGGNGREEGNENQEDNNQNGEGNQGTNGGRGNENNANQSGENGNNPEQDNQDETQEEIKDTMPNQNTTITTSSNPIDKATQKLPQTGTINGIIVFIVLIIIILIAVVMYQKWKKANH